MEVGWVRGGVGGGWAGWVAPSMAAYLGYGDALQRVDDEHARDELLLRGRGGG